jgi:hypothetical protein
MSTKQKQNNPHTKGADAPPSAVGKSKSKKPKNDALAFRPRNLATLKSADFGVSNIALLKSTYDEEDKAVQAAVGKFAEAQVQANLIAEEELIPHLAIIHALLSKQGTNHKLVSEYNKAHPDTRLMWWEEYYDSCKGRIWQSMRSIQRKIAAHNANVTAPVYPGIAPKPKGGGDVVPHLGKASRTALIDTACNFNELVLAHDAGRDITEYINKQKQSMPPGKLSDIVSTESQMPDYKALLEKVLSELPSIAENIAKQTKDGNNNSVGLLDSYIARYRSQMAANVMTPAQRKAAKEAKKSADEATKRLRAEERKEAAKAAAAAKQFKKAEAERTKLAKKQAELDKKEKALLASPPVVKVYFYVRESDGMYALYDRTTIAHAPGAKLLASGHVAAETEAMAWVEKMNDAFNEKQAQHPVEHAASAAKTGG